MLLYVKLICPSLTCEPRQVHRCSLRIAATEGLSVYVRGKSKAFSHCVIVTLAERPGFDHEGVLAAKRAATRFIISDIAVKDFDAVRGVDLPEEAWKRLDAYRKRLDSDESEDDPILMWLVCEK